MTYLAILIGIPRTLDLTRHIPVFLSWEMSKSFQQLEKSIGPALDTITTTFCMSALSTPNYHEEAILVCRATLVYAPDARVVAEFLDSPCFSHLDDVQLERVEEVWISSKSREEISRHTGSWL